ncbi:MAG: SCO family protein [Sphingobacteriales bacterium]|nr:MAG: SCO family protein [Sphingobacteriales bacterium]TAF82443.1 MAG: SCO family protein [Sphingobacteriales bacterium]
MYLSQCTSTPKKLPIYGEREAVKKIINGLETVDTVYQTIPNFSFLNQDSILINSDSLKNKIYVADFFFTSCPSICPIMKSQMLRAYQKFKNNNEVKFLSHTIDPKHDSIAVLKKFSDKLGVNPKQWYFLYGDKNTVYNLAKNSYMSSTFEDRAAPGGIVHSGYFILVDKNKRIRGAYDGTNEEQVSQMIEDMQALLNEYQTK